MIKHGGYLKPDGIRSDVDSSKFQMESMCFGEHKISALKVHFYEHNEFLCIAYSERLRDWAR